MRHQETLAKDGDPWKPGRVSYDPAADDDDRVRVTRHEDGLWVHFGRYASINLDEIVETSASPDFWEEALAFCERVAEPPEDAFGEGDEQV